MEIHPGNADTKTWGAYRDALFRFVLTRVSDETAAEDIVQEVLLKAYARQRTLREPAKLRAWLYQITRHEVVDYYRLRKSSDALPDDLMQEDTRDEDGRAQRELASCLVPLLDEVAEPYRQALRLADFEGVKQRDVASRLGLSVSGAKSRVQRGRRMLRDVLLKCCRVEVDRRGLPVDFEVGDGCSGCAPPHETC